MADIIFLTYRVKYFVRQHISQNKHKSKRDTNAKQTKDTSFSHSSKKVQSLILVNLLKKYGWSNCDCYKNSFPNNFQSSLFIIQTLWLWCYFFWLWLFIFLRLCHYFFWFYNLLQLQKLTSYKLINKNLKFQDIKILNILLKPVKFIIA